MIILIEKQRCFMWQILVWIIARQWKRQVLTIQRSLRRWWGRWVWKTSLEDQPEPIDRLIVGSVFNRLSSTTRQSLAQCSITLTPGIAAQYPALIIFSDDPEPFEMPEAERLLSEVANAFRVAHYCHQVVVHGPGHKTEMQYFPNPGTWLIKQFSGSEPSC